MKILHIDSSVQGTASVSRQLSSEFVTAWTAAHADAQVIYRDLALHMPPPLTAENVAAIRGEKVELSLQVQADVALLDAMLEEFLAADMIVIGAPMYNFSVPAPLKAWIDSLARAGRTFAYTSQGPKGLATGKRIVIASSRGNIYTTPQMESKDFQERYLVAALGFMGIERFDIVRAEGVNRGPEVRAAALEAARQAIAALVSTTSAA